MRRRAAAGDAERRENFFLTPLGIVFTTVVIDLIGFGIVVPILPLWAEDLGASATVIGFLAASYSAMQFIFAPLLGHLSDRYGRRPVILISLLGSAVSSFMIGFAGSILVLFVARIVNGISGASYSTAQAYVADITTKENRARGMGLIGAAFGIGFIIGPALGGLCAIVDKRLPFFVSGALALANMAIAYKRLPETDHRPSTSSGRMSFMRRALRDKSIGPFVVITFLATFAFTGMETTFSLLGRRRFDFDLTKASLVFAFIGVAAAVLQGKLIGPIVERLGERRVMNLGIVLTAVALGLLGITTNIVALFPVAALLAASGLVFPTVTAMVSNAAADDEQGAMLGVLASASGLARAVGPVAAGALFDWAIPAPYLVGAGLFAVCLLIGRTIREPKRDVAAAQ
jgi:multidrug resistance protein